MTRHLTKLVLLGLLTLALKHSLGQSDGENVLIRFMRTDEGEVPMGVVLAGGALYGTAEMGGTGTCTFPGQGCGEVYEVTLARDASGAAVAQKRLIYDFQGGADAAIPLAPLVLGPDGNLYGTTADGGGTACGFGCGTVFELSTTGGHWAESVLYSFSGPDGNTPESPVTFDSAGNIYGTTFNGGLNDCVRDGPCGVVYELQRTDSGWTEIVLHEFDYKDGQQPVGGVVMDGSGNLYGTTPWGGSPRLDAYEPAGTIYELSPKQTGWLFQVLYRFPGGAGQSFAGLKLDAAGNLYGTTTVGGIYGAGSVFELQRPTKSGDPWTFVNIFSFEGPNGSYPVSGVVFDEAGNLYGAAGGGGTGQNCDGPCGIVYELTPSDSGWAETILHNFQGDTDGAYANSTPVLDPMGNLYGTTAYGGDPNCVPFPEYSGCGIMYRINRGSPKL